MLELHRNQRDILADRLPDAANVAAGALVFGQFLGERDFSPLLTACGLALWVFFVASAVAPAGWIEP